MKIYYNFNGNMIRIDNIQKMFIDDQKIILQIIDDSKIITDSVSYENVKFETMSVDNEGMREYRAHNDETSLI